MTMQLAVRQFTLPTDRRLQFIKQLGVDNLLLDAGAVPGETEWAFRDLLSLRTRCEDGGVRLVAIENIPRKFCERAMLGLPGRDEEIERMATTIRNIGRAGIPSLAYAWMYSYCRTSSTTRGRGGAKVTSFDMALAENAPPSAGRIYSDDEMWANYEYFIRAVVPVAEEAGVKLALHPDDPPVESLDGVARIFRDFEGFKRAIEIVDSPVHGLHFCVGCWSEMGARVLDAMRYFGERDNIPRALSRRTGHGAQIPGVLRRRGKHGYGRGPQNAQGGRLHGDCGPRSRASHGRRYALGSQGARLHHRVYEGSSQDAVTGLVALLPGTGTIWTTRQRDR
jgi:mannonate dehydratase